MNNFEILTDEKTIVIDIHKFKVLEAKCYFERELAKINTKNINEVIIIHGYNNGTKLKNMISYELRSRKIARKMSFWNEGRTSLILKQ